MLDAGYEVTTVPGPAAFVAALVVSGLPTGRFVFEGFLPRSGRARAERLAELADRARARSCSTRRRTASRARWPTSPRRSAPTAAVGVARELTKLYETVVRGTLGDVDLGAPRGEYVLVVAGAPAADAAPDDDAVRAALRGELAAGRVAPRRRGRGRPAARRRPACGVRPGDRRTRSADQGLP